MSDDTVMSRVFHLLKEDEPIECTLVLRLKAPEGPGPFGCEYEISAQDKHLTMTIFGEDGLQALVLAISAAAVEIKVLARELGAKVDPDEFSVIAPLWPDGVDPIP